MDVKEAVQAAKHYVSDLFSDEGASNLRLEEVEFDGDAGTWNITVGFSRRAKQEAANGVAAALAPLFRIEQDLKVVRIDDKDERVLSVRNREPYG
jgi:hypothetical protein